MTTALHLNARPLSAAILCLLAAISPAWAFADPAYDAVVDQLIAVHRETPAYEIRFRAGSEFASDTPPAMLEMVRRTPGVEVSEDLVPGRVVYLLTHGTWRSDGGQRIRIERSNLLNGGNPQRSTQIEVWSSGETATAPHQGASQVPLYRMDPLDFAGLAAAHAAGNTTHEMRRALAGYLPMARYAGRVFKEDPRGAIMERTPDTVTLEAPSVGFRAVIDARTGELLQSTITDTSGLSVRTSYQGWWDRPWFPARHPRRIVTENLRAGAAGAGAQVEFGEVVIVDAIGPGASIRDEDFRWTSIGVSALDLRTQNVIRPDGEVDDMRSAQRRAVLASSEPAAVISTEGGLKPNERASGPGRWIAIVSCVALAAGGVLWIRRRWAM